MVNEILEVKFATQLARNSMRIVLGFFVLVICLLVVERYINKTWMEQEYGDYVRAEQLAGQILLADEKLTNSAIAFAFSRNPAWKRSYEENVPVIEGAIAEVKKLVTIETARKFDLETRAANDRLIELETSAFELASKGDSFAALRLLRGGEYSVTKSVLAKGSDRMLASLKAERSASITLTARTGWILIFGLVGVAIVTFGILWIRLNKALLRSEAAFLASEIQIREELSTAHVALLRQSKLSALGQLTATIAHELRNPLGAVRTSAFLMERKLGDRKLEFSGPLERIQTGVVRCDNIITQLLDYSRSTPANKVEIELDAWIESELTEQAESLPQNIEIRCELGLGVKKVGMDAERMRRVIANLVSNASEAMVGKGEKLFTIDGGSPVLKIKSFLTDRGVEVSVSDNGPGIPDDVLAKIFDPLFTTKSFGTGLGLPAVQKIMEMHSGGLEVKSLHGAGTTFTFWLPSNESAEERVVAA